MPSTCLSGQRKGADGSMHRSSTRIGNTPTVLLRNVGPEHPTIYAKAEFFHPGASVKDRLALAIIETAEQSGALAPGQSVIEATSGNTGICLAMVCAQKGYPLIVTMADSSSIERRRLMRVLGAKVVLTPRSGKGLGMYRKTVELVEATGWFLANQFETPVNAAIHEATTGREIIADFAGSRLDWFVTGYGTGGTLAGVSTVVRAERPETRIALIEPANPQLLISGTPQERGDGDVPSATHPSFEPHPIQGWRPDFIPHVLHQTLARNAHDDLLPVSGAETMEWTRTLARKEGILTGISGGATLAADRRIAERAPEGSVILCMLPDIGERYMSTPLFETIATEMDEAEMAIPRSTPGYQLEAD